MSLQNRHLCIVLSSNLPSAFLSFVSVPLRFVSSKQWQARRFKDMYWREANVKGLKSRAAFKLLQINARYRIFSPGQTVVDLGYAPGAWSQVAVDFTRPHGRVLGIDIIPAQPPKGVSTIQGNFLSPRIQAYVREFLRNHDRGRSRKEESLPVHSHHESTTEVETVNFESGHINREKCANKVTIGEHSLHHSAGVDGTVDVVLSDMMMNTSGIRVRDHTGSMDLCGAALQFSFDVLKPGGHFICKFYQGDEDQAFEARLKSLFQNVYREKPRSSHKESKEVYYIGLGRRTDTVASDMIF